MTTGGATRRWAARPLRARLIRVCVFMVPVAGSVVSVHVFSRLVEMPTSSFLLFILWWVAMSVAATGVLVVLDRAARRLLPLAALLNLSLAFPDAAPSRFRTAMRSNTVETLAERVEHARALNDGSTPVEEAERLLALVAQLNVHDRITRGHSDRVRAYAQLIGRELHLTPNELDALNWAALLHDVGKLKVPAEILNKPGRPTDDEWVVLRRHTVYGEQLIAPLRAWLGEWSHAVGQHHERWNGSGYPYRLAGDGISLAARIVAVADVFDVITSARSYKAPLSSAVARDEIARSTGTHFDPRVVRAFLGVSLGRLRLVMGPLSWLAHAPILGRLPLTPAVGTMAVSMATVAGALATGLVTAPPPPGAARIVPAAMQAPTEANPIERATREDENVVVGVGQSGGGARVSSLRVVAQPSVGHVRVTPDHRLLYSPPPDFNGVVSVRYRACWPGRGCRLGVLLIRVLPVNDPPTARNDLSVTESGGTIAIDVLANDSDPEGDPLSIRSVTDVDVGDARIVGRRVRWSSPRGFVGTVSFGYTVGDGQGGRAGALATIRVTGAPPPSPTEESQPGESATPVAAPVETPTVVPAPAPAAAPASPPASPPVRPPLARADRLSVPAGGTVLVDVLANDADPDGGALSIVSVGLPARGAARRVGDRVQFTAPSDYVGPVAFPYTIADPQGARDSATVSVTVLLVNTPPTFTPGPDQSVAEDAGPQSVPGWARDIDPGATSEVNQAVSFAVATDNSSLFAEQPRIGPSGDLSYTPAPNAHGSATVTVRAQDNGGTANGGRDASAPVPFTITVAPVNDPPLAKSDDVSVAEDDAAGVTFNVLGNDVDADVGDTIVVSSHNGSAIASGTLTDNGGGSFTYVPDSDFVGSATFSYTASDGNGGTATAVVTLSVTSRPDAPDAADDAYTTPVATALAPGAPGVLGNDADADGDTLTVQTTPVVAPANGILVLGSDGSFTYTPADGFSGTDSFTYRIDDGTGLTDDAVATITVSSSITLSSLYFAETGPLSTIWDMTAAPPAPASPVPDYDADGSPGLTIEQSDGKESNPDPTKFKAWAYMPSAPLVLNGPVTLQLWSTIADFGINKKGHPFVYLYDCAAGGAPCVKIAENDVHVNDWNGTTSTWMSRTITIGSVVHTIVPGRSLKVVLLFGHEDLWLAMTAAHPSGLTLSLG